MKKYQAIYTDPSPDELRDCIKHGHCWWCNTNGWRRLAQHTSMAHGIYADDIREMAILLKRKAVCVKEESEIMSERTLRLLKEGKRILPDGRLSNSAKHEYSEAGLKSLRDKMPIMRASLTDEVRKRATQKAIEKTSKPHPCPICGEIIPRAKPICCSEKCRRARQEIGLQLGRTLYADPEHRLRMTEILDKVRDKPKPHNCSGCGKLIPKSRPRKYCSPECARNPFQLPIEKIKKMYLNGISSVKIAKMYNCCDHTIRRHLRENGVNIKQRSRE